MIFIDSTVSSYSSTTGKQGGYSDRSALIECHADDLLRIKPWMMDKLRRFQQSLLGGEEDYEDEFLVESRGSLSLSPLQRLYAFAICLAAGLAFMLLSLVVFARPIKFAVMFSFGNLLAIGSTAFLIGPVQQTRMMLDPVRIYATFVYIITVILALFCALLIHNKVLTLIAMVIEICALIWYSLSYVPFARRMVSELLISCCDTDLS